MECTSPLEDIGLEAVSMQLKTTNGNTVNLTLKEHEAESDETNKLDFFLI